MLTGLDHIVLIAKRPEELANTYSRLMGRGPDWIARSDADNTITYLFRLNNASLEILGAVGADVAKHKINAMLGERDAQLISLAFATDEIDSEHKAFTRRRLNPSEITTGTSKHYQTGKTRSWRRFRLDTDCTAGIRTFVLENSPENRLTTQLVDPDCVSGLDHVVINSRSAQHAMAYYGAQLGAELKLDRLREDLSSRFLFFRIGDATLEVVTRIEDEFSSKHEDQLWGVSLQVHDINAAHDRVKSEGFQVSAVRDGVKIGSRVFTITDNTCHTSILFIQQTSK